MINEPCVKMTTEKWMILDAAQSRRILIDSINCYHLDSVGRWPIIDSPDTPPQAQKALERFIAASRKLADLELEHQDGILVEVTGYGKRLDGKHGVTGVLIARMHPHHINNHLSLGGVVKYL